MNVQSPGLASRILFASVLLAVGACERNVEPEIDAVAAGAALFKVRCLDCHHFGRRKVGPDLTGVTERRTHEWLMQWIDDPVPMAKTDPIAIALLEKYGTQMPDLNLKKIEIRRIISYLDTHREPAPDDTSNDAVKTLPETLANPE